MTQDINQILKYQELWALLYLLVMPEGILMDSDIRKYVMGYVYNDQPLTAFIIHPLVGILFLGASPSPCQYYPTQDRKQQLHVYYIDQC